MLYQPAVCIGRPSYIGRAFALLECLPFVQRHRLPCISPSRKGPGRQTPAESCLRLEPPARRLVKAMKLVGAIETQWDEGPTDGLGAMAGAWWCAEEAAKRGVPMEELELMQDVSKYNEVDCKIIMEIVEYLRANH